MTNPLRTNRPQRIDAHQHFWTLARGDYSWLTKDLMPIYRDFSTKDLAPLLAEAKIDKTLVVQAAPTVEETMFLLQLAEASDFVAGVVGWVDMEADDVLEKLEVLGDSIYFKGIRPMIADIADPQWMLSPKLDWVFSYLINNNLTFDALVQPQHLESLLILKQRYPKLKMVINHGAKPNIRNGELLVWAGDMKLMAELDNVSCKFSGLLTEAEDNAGFEELKPYTDSLLENFGEKRLMWGSDWPVLNLQSDYKTWISMAELAISELSGSEQALIMGENSHQFYKL